MTVLVLYYSSHGHVAAMAEAVAAGVREGGAAVDVRRMPETVPASVAKKQGERIEETVSVAAPGDPAADDAIIVGTPTRFGRVASQMASFWDRTGGLWMKGAPVGKVGAVFTSAGTQHRGQETTLFSMLSTMLHHGMVVTGLPCSFKEQRTLDEIAGGSPCGATTIAGGDDARAVSGIEKSGARFLGGTVAALALKLGAPR